MFRRVFIGAISALLVLASQASLAQTLVDKDVRVLQSDESGVTIEFTALHLNSKKFGDRGTVYTCLDFVNSVSLGFEHRGEPDMRYRTLLVGLPSEVGNTVDVLAAESQEISSVRLPPVPTYSRSDTGTGQTRTYVERSEAYGLNELIPKRIVELVELGAIRDQVVANVRITPLQYNPVASIVRKYTRIVVKVSFGASSAKTQAQSTERGDSFLKSMMINYDVARNWKTAQPSRLSKLTSNSVLASGTWYRMEVRDDGVYKLNADYFKAAGISLSGIDPRTIRIYSNGGLELPEDVNASRPVDLIENAIYVSGEQDGSFDSNDYVLFYGKGVNGWKYSSTTKSFDHYINHYTTSNYYWLTYGGSQGKRMGTISGGLTNPSPYRPSSTVGKIFLEQEVNKTDVRSGREWFGQEFDSENPTFSYMNKLDGLDTNSSVTYKIMMVARSGAMSSFKVEEGGSVLGFIQIPAVVPSSDETEYAAKSGVVQFSGTGKLADSRSVLKFTYFPNSTGDEAWTDWFEILYRRDFKAVSDVVHLTSPDTNATVEYDLRDFSNSDIMGFDVTDFANVVRIASPYISGSEFRFQTLQTAGSVDEYFVVGANGYKTPITVLKVTNSNLRGIADGGDFVIITHPDFLDDAKRLKQHRESASGGDALQTVVVDVTSIYNEFSGGLLDPTAIRDFLRYAYSTWTTKPSYALLFGDGTYDYKNVLGKGGNYIPPYETTESLYQINTYASDDFFVRIFPSNPRDQMAIGRLTVQSVQDATTVVDKIISYDESLVADPWKNRLTFVADDGFTSGGGDDGSMHTDQSELLANYHTPKQFEQKKIYLIQYPTVISSAGRRKPDVNQAIIDQFNQGTLTINWTGHGNMDVWAHEHVFERETTIPKLDNADKLAFLTAATCDFGRYDDPESQSGAELLLTKNGGGVIAAVSTDRVAYADENRDFNNAFYDHLLARNADGSATRIGDAMLGVKQLFTSTNDTKFHILGDPTVKLAMPRYNATIDSINDMRSDKVVQLKALSKVSVKGSVRKPDGGTWSDYQGTLFITVFDAERQISIAEGVGVFNFNLPGGIIYKGDASITKGGFTSIFPVPKDISYESNQGRLAVYFKSSSGDGSGYNQNITIGGMDSAVVADPTGPSLTVYVGDRNFRNGDLVNDHPRLLVDLLAKNGLNISGVGVGHGLQAWLDNSENSIDLAEYYQGKMDSYQEGTVDYQLNSLVDGTHTIKVRAWDVFNNSGTTEVSFQVASSTALTLKNVLNYPNPFRSSTTFTFEHNQDNPVDIEIKIYTLSGRLIQTLEQRDVTQRFVKVPWDGRDADGDELANGVYFYRLVVKTEDGGSSREEVGKLAIVK